MEVFKIFNIWNLLHFSELSLLPKCDRVEWSPE